ncbi:unnamed protein product [Mesocestoides corti]|uniref:Uncharacterized protein n=1 Tax=Mesocestoides corti TaxID=53468 RepID=A0A0R3UBV5_MESCO|nr:unnamed protein product [Mesocestoides corti]
MKGRPYERRHERSECAGKSNCSFDAHSSSTDTSKRLTTKPETTLSEDLVPVKALTTKFQITRKSPTAIEASDDEQTSTCSTLEHPVPTSTLLGPPPASTISQFDSQTPSDNPTDLPDTAKFTEMGISPKTTNTHSPHDTPTSDLYLMFTEEIVTISDTPFAATSALPDAESTFGGLSSFNSTDKFDVSDKFLTTPTLYGDKSLQVNHLL